VAATLDANSTLEEKPRFEYTSPTVADPEKDAINFKFTGLDGISDVITTSSSADTFTVSVDRTLITATNIGIYSLTVNMGDKITESSVVSKIDIEL